MLILLSICFIISLWTVGLLEMVLNIRSGLIYRDNFETTSTMNCGWIISIPTSGCDSCDTISLNSNESTGWRQQPARVSPVACSLARSFESSDFLLRNESLAFTRASYPGFQLVKEASFESAHKRVYHQVLYRAMSFTDLNIYRIS